MTSTVFTMVLAAALLHAVWNFIVKGDDDRLTMIATIVTSQAVIAALGLPFVTFPRAAAWPWLWTAVAIHQAYFFFLVMAYRHGDLSHVYPIARGSAPLVVAGVSAVFVGEVLTRQTMVAVTLIAAGIMSLALTRGADGLRNTRAVLFALGTGMLIAGYTVVDGVGARLAGSPHGYALWLIAIDGVPIALFTLCLQRRDALRRARRIWKVGCVGGLVSMVAYWIVIWALTLAPFALVSAIRETSIVFAVLLGVLFLKERLDLVRLAATTTTLVGAVLLKAAR